MGEPTLWKVWTWLDPVWVDPPHPDAVEASGWMVPVDVDIVAARNEMERLIGADIPLLWARMVLVAAGVLEANDG